MAGEIASAFVRIRPNMAGFKTETESGVRSAFSGVAKIIGLSLGAGAAFELGKEVIGSAASLQKQIETINAEFGAAGESVKKFGEQGATALGISASLADTTSARFGILFTNLGIGQSAAATMTINLQKLAGSLAAIRGVDPAEVLARLPLALAGNTRSLKQLGLAIDASQIKLAALKLGLISSINQAITPAIKAQAIYALATANLGKFQEQAKAHANDLANVQRRLSAEWSNAKEILGKALLPTFAALARELERWLERMQRSGRLQRDFNAIANATTTAVKFVIATVRTANSIFQTFARAVGGTKTAVIALLAAMAVSKVMPFVQAFGVGLVQALQRTRVQMSLAKLEYGESIGTMRAATLALSGTIRGALIATGIGLIPIAIGIATAFVITHWNTIRKVTIALAAGLVGTWEGIKTSLIGIAEVIGGSMAESLVLPFKAVLDAANAASHVPLLGRLLPKGDIEDAQKKLNGFTTDLIGKGVANIAKGGAAIAGGFADGFNKAVDSETTSQRSKRPLTDLGKKIGNTISDGVASVAGAGAAKVAKSTAEAAKLALAAADQRITNSVIAAKTNLDKIGQKLAATVNTIIDKLGGVGGALANAPQTAAFKKLKDLLASGAPEADIARTSRELSSDLTNVGKTQHQLLKTQIADLTDQFNKGVITTKQFNSKVAAVLKANGVNYKTAGKAGGKAFADTFQGELSALKEQAGAIAAVPARFRRAGGGGGDTSLKIIRPLNVIKTENAKIALRAERQREKQLKATAKSNVVLGQLAKVHVGALPGSKTKGTASKKARVSATAGIQP